MNGKKTREDINENPNKIQKTETKYWSNGMVKVSIQFEERVSVAPSQSETGFGPGHPPIWFDGCRLRTETTPGNLALISSHDKLCKSLLVLGLAIRLQLFWRRLSGFAFAITVWMTTEICRELRREQERIRRFRFAWRGWASCGPNGNWANKRRSGW